MRIRLERVKEEGKEKMEIAKSAVSIEV